MRPLGGELIQTMSIELSTWFPNRMAYWLFIIIFILWAASELFNTLWFRRYKNNRIIQTDDRSYWIIWLVIWISFILSFITRANNLGIFHNSIQYLGLLISMLGICLREWAVLTLGKYFTVTISIQHNQKLIKNGPYHWLRHPSYTGSILYLVGFLSFLFAVSRGIMIADLGQYYGGE